MTDAKKLILVVDDNAILRMTIRDMLEMAGYDVDSAAGGEEAITLAKKKHFHLIILDMLMPHPNGFEVYKQLKRLSVTSRTPILILSVLGLESKIQTLLNEGAHYIKKDEADDQLISKVMELIASGSSQPNNEGT